jgi:hypothetical protein
MTQAAYKPRGNTAKAIEMIRNGSTVREAAEATGCIPQSLRYALKKMGIKATPAPRNLTAGRRALYETQILRIQGLYRAGVARREIAQRFGVTYTTIFELTKNLKVDRPIISDLARGSRAALVMVR